jgi:hypothetical protein
VNELFEPGPIRYEIGEMVMVKAPFTLHLEHDSQSGVIIDTYENRHGFVSYKVMLSITEELEWFSDLELTYLLPLGEETATKK